LKSGRVCFDSAEKGKNPVSRGKGRLWKRRYICGLQFDRAGVPRNGTTGDAVLEEKFQVNHGAGLYRRHDSEKLKRTVNEHYGKAPPS